MRPTLTVTPIASACCTVLVAIVPAGIAVARDRPLSGMAVVLVTTAAGVALAWAADDPAAEVLAAMPVSGGARAGTRLAVLALAVAAVVGLSAAVAWACVPLPDGQADRLPEAAAAATLAVAAGLAAARAGDRRPGQTGLVLGLLGMLLVTALSQRWPRVLPGIAAGPVHARWWFVAAAGSVLVLAQMRDPGSKPLTALARRSRAADRRRRP